MTLVDIGVNLTHRQFHPDRSAVVERALSAGIAHMIVTGLNATVSQAALRLARAQPGVLSCTAGVHPHNARQYDRQTYDELLALARAPEVVAIGECGLDYDRDFSPRPQQRMAFESQLELAIATGKPVFLHERLAHEDFVAILANARSQLVGGIVHCFTGSALERDRYLELGLCIGITGFICDERRGRHLQQVVQGIPTDRLMVETDAPFLLPRDLARGEGRRNEPAHLTHVAAAVARCVGKSPGALATETTQNANRLFGLRVGVNPNP